VTRAIAAVVAVVAVVAGLIWLARPKDSGPDPRAWDQKASAAFKPLVGDVPDLVQGAREWQDGQRSKEDFTQQVDAAVADFELTRGRLAMLAPSPKNKAAGQLYAHSAQLYVGVGRIYEVMLATQAGDVRTQLDLLARRVRELADRVFDRGHAALAPYVSEPQAPDVEVRTPEEVPLWPEEGLAAGPPLDAPPPPAAASPPLRQQSRPQEGAPAWAKDVRAARIPSYAELSSAMDRVSANAKPDPSRPPITGPDRDRLGGLAQRFTAASERLRSRPDPKGQRDRSAVLRLGLLVEADAARAAQAATFLTGAPQRDLARTAAVVSGIGRDLVAEAKP